VVIVDTSPVSHFPIVYIVFYLIATNTKFLDFCLSFPFLNGLVGQKLILPLFTTLNVSPSPFRTIIRSSKPPWTWAPSRRDSKITSTAAPASVCRTSTPCLPIATFITR